MVSWGKVKVLLIIFRTFAEVYITIEKWQQKRDFQTSAESRR